MAGFIERGKLATVQHSLSLLSSLSRFIYLSPIFISLSLSLSLSPFIYLSPILLSLFIYLSFSYLSLSLSPSLSLLPSISFSLQVVKKRVMNLYYPRDCIWAGFAYITRLPIRILKLKSFFMQWLSFFFKFLLLRKMCSCKKYTHIYIYI